MLVEGKFLYYCDDLTEVFNIRKKVFHEEQGISLEEEFDEYDEYAVHVIVYVAGDLKKAVATGRLLFDGSNYRVGRIAVLKEERGKKYGDFVVRMLVNKAFISGAKEILIHAQVIAVPFYEKIGFRSFDEPFMEDGIQHIRMKLSQDNLCKKCIL